MISEAGMAKDVFPPGYGWLEPVSDRGWQKRQGWANNHLPSKLMFVVCR